jgi:hypothetical protein
MATVTSRLDDMNGETLPEDTPTTTIRVNDPRGDVSVELDLSDTSFKALQRALDKFVSKARPLTFPEEAKPSTDATEAAEARKWAIATNLQPPVSERGAVPKRAIDAYRAFLATGEQPDGPTTEDERKSSTDE